jgi:hypothetical protein
MKLLRGSTAVVLLTLVCFASYADAGPDADQAALQRTSEAIRAAFAKGDVAEAMAYHHPDVAKTLAFH